MRPYHCAYEPQRSVRTKRWQYIRRYVEREPYRRSLLLQKFLLPLAPLRGPLPLGRRRRRRRRGTTCCGTGEGKIVALHLLPSFLSYLIVSLTLAVPYMILGETALSFLGLGLRPPVVSWGVLLKDAQNVHAVLLHPWLLIPGLFVVAAVLAFNFLGDGLRDAADPYK